MFRSLLGKFADDYLVEITQRELRIISLSDAANYVDEPLIAIEVDEDKETVKAVGRVSRNCTGPGVKILNPFKHSRSMISSFNYAQKILRYALKSVRGNAFSAAPRVIMHQLEKNEGGLTEIEERVLRELALDAGAREVVVYQGDRINPRHETFDSIKSRTNAS